MNVENDIRSVWTFRTVSAPNLDLRPFGGKSVYELRSITVTALSQGWIEAAVSLWNSTRACSVCDVDDARMIEGIFVKAARRVGAELVDFPFGSPRNLKLPVYAGEEFADAERDAAIRIQACFAAAPAEQCLVTGCRYFGRSELEGLVMSA